MPKYRITDNQTGRIITVNGDSFPTDQEAQQIFQDAGLRQVNKGEGFNKPIEPGTLLYNIGSGIFGAEKGAQELAKGVPGLSNILQSMGLLEPRPLPKEVETTGKFKIPFVGGKLGIPETTTPFEAGRLAGETLPTFPAFGAGMSAAKSLALKAGIPQTTKLGRVVTEGAKVLGGTAATQAAFTPGGIEERAEATAGTFSPESLLFTAPFAALGLKGVKPKVKVPSAKQGFYRTIVKDGQTVQEAVPKARKVEINPEIVTFIHKQPESNNFIVIEKKTGLSLGNGAKTMKDAVEEARYTLEKNVELLKKKNQTLGQFIDEQAASIQSRLVGKPYTPELATKVLQEPEVPKTPEVAPQAITERPGAIPNRLLETLPPKEGYYVRRTVGGPEYAKLEEGEKLIPMKGFPDRPSHYSKREWEILNEDVKTTFTASDYDELRFWTNELRRVSKEGNRPEVFEQYRKFAKANPNPKIQVETLKSAVTSFRDKGGMIKLELQKQGRVSREPQPRPEEISQIPGARVAEVIGEETLPATEIIQKQPSTSNLLHKVFPKLKQESIEKKYGRLVVDGTKDLSGTWGDIQRWFAPIRNLASMNPISAQVARLGRNTDMSISAEQADLEQSLKLVYSGIKDKEKETLSNLIEANLSKAELAKLPTNIRKALQGKRKLNQLAKDYAETYLGIDTSKWRFTPENYMHHLFVGSQEVYDAVTGKILAFAKSRSEALEVAEGLLSKNKSINIGIRPRGLRSDYSATMLSRKGFWNFISKAAEALDMDKNDVLQEISMKGVAAMKPRKKFIGAFNPRIANLQGYVKDPEYVDKVLWTKMIKKKNIDNFTKETASLLEKLPQNLRAEMQNYVDTLAGKWYPYGGSLSSKITKWQTYLKLGYRPTAATVNRLQPITTAYPLLGEKYILKGIKAGLTREGRNFADSLGVTFIKGKYYALEHPGKEALADKIYHPMGMFGKMEQQNRIDIANAAYFYGKDHLKLDIINKAMKDTGLKPFGSLDDLSRQFAKDVISGTQFLYDVADVSRIMRTPLGRVALQFKPFMINYLYNVSRILKGEVPGGLEVYFPKGLSGQQKIAQATRWVGASVAMGGLRTLSFGLDRFAPAAVLVWMFQHPILARGLPGLLGIDVSQQVGIEPLQPFSDSIAEVALGPTGGDIKTFFDALKEGNWAVATRISPAASKLYQALTGDDYIRNPYQRNRPIAKITPLEKFTMALGFNPLSLSQTRLAHQIITKKTEERTGAKSNLVDEIITANKNRDFEKASELRQEARKRKITITSEDIKNAKEALETPSLERRRIPKDILRELRGIPGFLDYLGK